MFYFNKHRSNGYIEYYVFFEDSIVQGCATVALILKLKLARKK